MLQIGFEHLAFCFQIRPQAFIAHLGQFQGICEALAHFQPVFHFFAQLGQAFHYLLRLFG